MSAIFLYQDENNDTMKKLLVSMAVFIRFKDYQFKDPTDPTFSELKLKAKSKSQTIIAPDDYFVTPELYGDNLETVRNRKMWGYDYILHFRLSKDEEFHISTTDPEDILSSNLAKAFNTEIRSIDIPENIIYQDPDGETYDTKYWLIEIPEENINAVRPLFNDILSGIKKIDIHDRWYWDGHGWIRTKSVATIKKEIESIDRKFLYQMPNGYYSNDEIVPFIDHNGNPRYSYFNTVGYVISDGMTGIGYLKSKKEFRTIYIPKGCRYSRSGWFFFENRWHLYGEDHLDYNGKISIDGTEYLVNRGILYSNEEFVLADDNTLHHKNLKEANADA